MKTVNTDTRTIHNGNLETRYDVSDFVNDFDPSGKAFVILNGGYIMAIVFSEYYGYREQDALDEACDSGKLDAFQVSESELKDYETGNVSDEGFPEYEGLDYLGNASEPFSLDSLDIWVLSAELFADEPCLMTEDRVMQRLEDRKDTFETTYRATDTEDKTWLEAYRNVEDAEDAITLYRLMLHR